MTFKTDIKVGDRVMCNSPAWDTLQGSGVVMIVDEIDDELPFGIKLDKNSHAHADWFRAKDVTRIGNVAAAAPAHTVLSQNGIEYATLSEALETLFEIGATLERGEVIAAIRIKLPQSGFISDILHVLDIDGGKYVVRKYLESSVKFFHEDMAKVDSK